MISIVSLRLAQRDDSEQMGALNLNDLKVEGPSLREISNRSLAQAKFLWHRKLSSHL
jgi:hypothetical protein